MTIARIEIDAFRNLRNQTIDLPADGLAIVGDNGHGKTNLLEAVHYLELFRSFRGATDEKLAPVGGTHFRVVVHQQDGGSVAAAWERSTKRKRITVNGEVTDKTSRAVGKLGAVIFSPADVALVVEGPASRRRFLDVVLSLGDPVYLAALQRYRHTVLQRNEALRRNESAAAVDLWTDALTAPAITILRERARWVSRNRDEFALLVHRISGSDDGDMRYESTVATQDELGALDDADLALRLKSAFDKGIERDRRIGATLTGPHRDDLRLLLARVDGVGTIGLREYGSGGQQRTAAIALRMIEAASVQERLDRPALLLLDDLFAELDPGRSRRVHDLLESREHGQVILTAPKPSDLELRNGRLRQATLRHGVLEIA